MKNSRTSKSLNNAKWGMVLKLTMLVMRFAIRTVFIYYLGREYVGINGVFGNILTVLSLTELGIGTAIVYDLYKPIANGDTTTITQLYRFYKRVYGIIGIIVITIGLLMMPFLNVLLKEIPNVNSIEIIYLFTLLGTAEGYFFAHNSSLIEANQRQDIVSKYNTINMIIKSIAEIIVVVILKSYIVYLIVDFASMLIMNLAISNKAKAMFPFIKNKVDSVSKEVVYRITKNSLSVFSLNAASVVVNATDTALVSSIISTLVAGSFSTYMMLVMSVQQVVYVIKLSVVASTGNLCATDDYSSKRTVFWRLEFLFYGINTVVCSCFLNLLTPFVSLWAGQEYIIDNITILFIVINYFMRGIQWPIEVFYSADGAFKYFGIKPWIEIILNFVFSIPLANLMGLPGIVIGTTVSELLTTFWFDIYITNKYSLKGSIKEYWIRTVRYIIVCWSIILLTRLICMFIIIDNVIIHIVVNLGISIAVSVLLFLMTFRNTKEMAYTINLIKSIISNYLRKS